MFKILTRTQGFLRRKLHTIREQQLNRFLDSSRGVIHVGANLGQERDFYASKNLNVLWIEPIPEVFSKLEASISGFPKQRAICRLITDTDKRKYTFHIASNEGASSSILNMKEHPKLWPDIRYTKTLELVGTSLNSLILEEGLVLSDFDALILDTQGSELLVIRGASSVISHFRHIRTEIADFESYENGVTLSEMDCYLESINFTRTGLIRGLAAPGIGSYYEALYSNLASRI